MPRGNLNRAAGTKRPASETGFNGSNRKAQRSTADATASKREAAEVTDSAYVQFLRLEVDRIYKSFKDTTSNKVWFTKAMAQLKNLLDDPQLETVSFNTYFASAIAHLTRELSGMSTNATAVELFGAIKTLCGKAESARTFIKMGEANKQPEIDSMTSYHQNKIDLLTAEVASLKDEQKNSIQGQLDKTNRTNELLIEGFTTFSANQKQFSEEQGRLILMLEDSKPSENQSAVKLAKDGKIQEVNKKDPSTAKNKNRIFAGELHADVPVLDKAGKNEMSNVMGSERLKLLCQLVPLMSGINSDAAISAYNLIKKNNGISLSVLAKQVDMTALAIVKAFFVDDTTSIQNEKREKYIAKHGGDEFVQMRFASFENKMKISNLVSLVSLDTSFNS